MDGPLPKVGVGLLIFKEGKVLMGKRMNAHGDGFYCGPGGHLETGETIEECAARETREETGMEITNIRVISLGNLLTFAPKHYVDIAVAADWKAGEPQNLEPDKRDGWGWYELDNLPQPLWPAEELYFDALKTGRWYLGTIR